MTDVRLPLWHMTADINHLMIKVSVALLVSSYSRCHLRQSDRDILHGSLISANRFALLQLWNLDSLASLWRLGNYSCCFHKPTRVNLHFIPTSPGFRWLPSRTYEGWQSQPNLSLGPWCQPCIFYSSTYLPWFTKFYNLFLDCLWVWGFVILEWFPPCVLHPV